MVEWHIYKTRQEDCHSTNFAEWVKLKVNQFASSSQSLFQRVNFFLFCFWFGSFEHHNLSLLFHLTVKTGRYMTLQQRQQSTNYVERTNTTVSLKVNHQNFISALHVIYCERRRRVIRYISGRWSVVLQPSAEESNVIPRAKLRGPWEWMVLIASTKYVNSNSLTSWIKWRIQFSSKEPLKIGNFTRIVWAAILQGCKHFWWNLCYNSFFYSQASFKVPISPKIFVVPGSTPWRRLHIVNRFTSCELGFLYFSVHLLYSVAICVGDLYQFMAAIY